MTKCAQMSVESIRVALKNCAQMSDVLSSLKDVKCQPQKEKDDENPFQRKAYRPNKGGIAWVPSPPGKTSGSSC